jgi:23S rRNA pseudouridine2605 synthase
MAKKTKKSTETDGLQPLSTEPEVKVKRKAKKAAKIPDPIGDETDGEAQVALEPETEAKTEARIEAKSETEIEAEDGPEPEAEVSPEPESENDPETESEDSPEPEAEDEPEDEPEFKPRPPAKLDRLQKILAQAGVASRRKAEELIEQGRVQVNGKIVTELGTKADAGRDHIRVDGKLLQGAERLRYFVLNKPKGFVTTVKDPEGRPTVMQFFDKMRERLYPVGRLDYMSEGLLLVTNDGELANRLTRASAGVEKTYLVKVAGIPTEDELDRLRGGVSIERGKPGSPKVRTSPARIRQVRQGDNPWYEVVLIEGRNRELRKMFEEVGHFVEKIRRVGYGPLVLDQEPGNLRELDPQELELLRKAADGKLRTPKSKEVRRRNAADAGQLPTITPRTTGSRPAKPFGTKSFEERPAAGPKDYRPKRSFAQGPNPSSDRARPARPASGEFRPVRASGATRSSAEGYRPNTRPSARPAWQKDARPTRPPTHFAADSTGEARPSAGRTYGAKPFAAKPYGARSFAAKPFESGPAAGRATPSKPPANRTYPARPTGGKPYGDKPAATRTYGAKPAAGRAFAPKPAWKKPEAQQWPPYKRPPGDRPAQARRESPVHDEDLGPVRPPNLHIEEIHGSDRPSSERSSPSRASAPRAGAPRTSASYSRPDRPSSGRPGSDRSGSDRSGPDRSGSSRSNPARSSSARPFRGSEGGLARPFTTSSGKPRAGGARPSSKPGRPSSRSYGAGSSAPRSGPRAEAGSRPYTGSAPRPSSSSRPYPPREEGASDFRPSPAKPYPNSASRAERKAGPGWKPKPSFGGPSKPGSSARSKPKPGSSGKSGYKGKPSGPKRTGAPGGKKRR